MATSSIIKKDCSICGKLAVEESKIVLGSSTIIRLVCGHLATFENVETVATAYDSIVFSDGKSPREYQIEAVKFAERANFNCIIADEQGLGKTIELLSLIKLHPDKLLPAVIVVPTTVKIQWMLEIQRICCPNDTFQEKQQFLTQVIQTTKQRALPGFSIYIITFDMLKKEDMFEYVDDIKLIVIDECQRIKNHLSDRAKAVQRISAKCDFHIPMSGTPISNNVGEYFTVLNMVKPTRFHSYQGYLDTYCQTSESGWTVKVGGLKSIERFQADTNDIIIRRTKDQVLKDLPSKDRKFFHVELDAKVNKAYAKAMEELEELYYSDDNSFSSGAQKIAIIGRLRHLTGISKVDDCVDFVTEFLLSTDRPITIFVHHHDVASLLEARLNEWLKDGNYGNALMMHSGLNGDARQALAVKFKDNMHYHRVMIASTQAAGEGLNLQFCSDAVMHERQWNPPREVQAEDRHHRFGQLNPVSITYMIASGTVDDYFTQIVEKKRSIIGSAMDGVETKWDESSLMKELTEVLVTKGRKQWSI